MIELAKHQLDIGLTTEDRDETLAFWQNEVGLTYDGPLSVGGGVQQHRHSFRGSIIKINHSRNPVEPEPPSGYRRVFVAQPDRTEVHETSDPGGNQVVLVPPGHDGITQLALSRSACATSHEHGHFWGDLVGLPAAPRVGCRMRSASATRCSASSTTPRHRATRLAAAPAIATARSRSSTPTPSTGSCIAAGARDGHEPFTHGDVARYGFIRDPDGNWIELSQRASITGPLPLT